MYIYVYVKGPECAGYICNHHHHNISNISHPERSPLADIMLDEEYMWIMPTAHTIAILEPVPTYSLSAPPTLAALALFLNLLSLPAFLMPPSCTLSPATAGFLLLTS